MIPSPSARERRERSLRIALPVAVLALGLLIWDAAVRFWEIPPYVLPTPGLVLRTLVTDWSVLSQSLLVTLTTTFEGFLLASVGGVGLAVLFNQSRFIEYSLYPYAVILQVTPVIAIAPLLLVYLQQPTAVLVCAWIVAFFPVLANTTLGTQVRSIAIYRTCSRCTAPLAWMCSGISSCRRRCHTCSAACASPAACRWSAPWPPRSRRARPARARDLPFASSSSEYRLNIPRMFAALFLLSVTGIVIFYLLALVNHLALRRWHESALAQER